MARNEVVDDARRAFVRDMDHLGAGLMLEQLHGQMEYAAGARRRIVEFPRPLFGPGDQLFHRLRRKVVGDQQAQWARSHQHDRGEALVGIVRQLRVYRRQCAESGRGEEERVAVGIGFCHGVDADDAGRARPVFHHDRNAPAL